ncbi:MAG: isochorismate synthase [Gammaproteobacteria bacterium]
MFPKASAAHTGNVLDRLRQMLQASRDDWQDTSPDHLFSFNLEVDEAHLRPSLDQTEDEFYWYRPVDHLVVAGVGKAAEYSAIGAERFSRLDAAHRALAGEWTQLGSVPACGPLAVVGFAFDPADQPGPEWGGLKNSMMAVPSVLFRRSGDRAALNFSATGSALADVDAQLETWADQLARFRRPQSSPRPVLNGQMLEQISENDTWRRRVEQALSAIHSGRLDKVVLTRRVRFRSQRVLDCAQVMDFLDQRHDACAHFAIAKGGRTLLGVSPERLLALHEGTVTVDALAGTTPRGQNPGHDSRLAEALMTDPKVCEEHRLVVDEIRSALTPVCSDLNFPQQPKIMPLPQVQHLWTPVTGKVKNGEGLLAIARRLHPTPAVGGSPRQAAAKWLADSGEPGRGWYTGACGWIDARGNGELSVILRCGLVSGRTADLFAGAGIVADSRPEQELAETEWKLLTMLGALRLG